jgi:hypothetical protein
LQSAKPWNDGMVEQWNIGYEKQIAFRQTQYSNIPSFQYPMTLDYGKAANF